MTRHEFDIHHHHQLAAPPTLSSTADPTADGLHGVDYVNDADAHVAPWLPRLPLPPAPACALDPWPQRDASKRGPDVFQQRGDGQYDAREQLEA